MWSKFAGVRKVTANLSKTCGFAVAEYLLQFCGICGCGIECKLAVPSSVENTNKFLAAINVKITLNKLCKKRWMKLIAIPFQWDKLLTNIAYQLLP